MSEPSQSNGGNRGKRSGTRDPEVTAGACRGAGRGGEWMYMYGRLVRLQRSLYVWGSEEETGKQREHEENTEKKRLGGQREKRDKRADEEEGNHQRDEWRWKLDCIRREE